jgi:hypothetical protein
MPQFYSPGLCIPKSDAKILAMACRSQLARLVGTSSNGGCSSGGRRPRMPGPLRSGPGHDRDAAEVGTQLPAGQRGRAHAARPWAPSNQSSVASGGREVLGAVGAAYSTNVNGIWSVTPEGRVGVGFEIAVGYSHSDLLWSWDCPWP